MIVTEILGNTHEVTGRSLIGERHVEKIVLPSADLVKRIQRVTTEPTAPSLVCGCRRLP